MDMSELLSAPRSCAATETGWNDAMAAATTSDKTPRTTIEGDK